MHLLWARSSHMDANWQSQGDLFMFLRPEGFFPSSYLIYCREGKSHPGKVSSARAMQLLEKCSGPLPALKLVGLEKLLSSFCHEYCTGLYKQRQEASLLSTTIAPTTTSLYASDLNLVREIAENPPSNISPCPSFCRAPWANPSNPLTLSQVKHLLSVNHVLTCFAEWIWFAKLGLWFYVGRFCLIKSIFTIKEHNNPSKTETCKPKTDAV